MRKLETKTESFLECEISTENLVLADGFLRQRLVQITTRIKGYGRCWKRSVYPPNRSGNEVQRKLLSHTRADALPRTVSHAAIEIMSSLINPLKLTVPRLEVSVIAIDTCPEGVRPRTATLAKRRPCLKFTRVMLLNLQ
jgi:hypothetical protein